jgi:hypothetical protein
MQKMKGFFFNVSTIDDGSAIKLPAALSRSVQETSQSAKDI